MDIAITRPHIAGTHPTVADELLRSAWFLFWNKQLDVSAAPGIWTSLSAISELSQLPEDWDGYGAARISPLAVYHASHLLSTSFRSLPAPDVVPNTNGTISLEWESMIGTAHLEIGATTFMLSLVSDDRPAYITGKIEEIGSPLAGLIASNVYPEPSKSITDIYFTAEFRRAA